MASLRRDIGRTRTSIGKRLRLNGPDGPPATVVGIAKTVRYLLPWEQPQPYVYLPYEQSPRSSMSLVAGSADNSTALAGRLRETIQRLAPEMPFNVRTVASFAQSTLSNWLVLIQMITVMGVLGLILALVGLYGLVSYAVSRRTAEIGVRMAMGASRGNILRSVLRRAAVLSATGVLVGSALTVMASWYPGALSRIRGPGLDECRQLRCHPSLAAVCEHRRVLCAGTTRREPRPSTSPPLRIGAGPRQIGRQRADLILGTATLNPSLKNTIMPLQQNATISALH